MYYCITTTHTCECAISLNVIDMSAPRLPTHFNPAYERWSWSMTLRGRTTERPTTHPSKWNAAFSPPVWVASSSSSLPF